MIKEPNHTDNKTAIDLKTELDSENQNPEQTPNDDQKQLFPEEPVALPENSTYIIDPIKSLHTKSTEFSIDAPKKPSIPITEPDNEQALFDQLGKRPQLATTTNQQD